MTKGQLIMSLAAGLLFLGLAYLRPAQYRSELSIFVPLTFLEKQIQQNGIGFGSPAEVDAHLELLRSPRVEESLKERFPKVNFEMSVSKTRNGAVKVEIWTEESPERSAQLANAAVAITDSLKQIMLLQNVGQSLAFVDHNLKETRREMLRLQNRLDSLRFEAVKDSLGLASEVFKYERLYGSEVVALNELKMRKERLQSNLKAPSPKSYIIHPATIAKKAEGLPPWAVGVLAAVLVALGFYVYHLYLKGFAA